MAEKAILEIPDGYKIEEKSYIVDRETACRILTSDKQRKFTYAKKCGEKVELTQHIIICPVCGHRMPAYPRYTNGWLTQSSSKIAKTPKNVIRQWCEDKISDSKDTIYLNFISQPMLENVIYTCPECRCESNLFSKIVRCELNYRRHKLSISRQIDDTKALLSVSWLKGTVSVNFPMYEVLHLTSETVTRSCGFWTETGRQLQHAMSPSERSFCRIAFLQDYWGVIKESFALSKKFLSANGSQNCLLKHRSSI